MPVNNLLGQKFGRLTAIERRGSDRKRQALWLFRCDCGAEVVKDGRSVSTGNTSSCGCLATELLRARLTTHGFTMTGAKHPPEYTSWALAKARCFNRNNPDWKYYGGRGITMAECWRTDFAAFRRDMGPRPPGLTLERKDVNGNYEPSNCTWATRKQQMNNTRRTRRFRHAGKTKTLNQLATEFGVPRAFLYDHLIVRGDSLAAVVKAMTGDGFRKLRKFYVRGKKVTLLRAAEVSGLKPGTIWGRIIRGWPDRRLLEPLARRRRE